MKTTWRIREFAPGNWCVLIIVLLMALPWDARADTKVELLRTRTGYLTNVTLFSRTKDDVFLSHSRGLNNVKIKDLGEEAQLALGLITAASLKKADAPDTTTEKITSTVANLTGAANMNNLQAQMQEKMLLFRGSAAPEGKLNPQFLAVGAGVLLVFYLLFSYCLKLICEKTGLKPGPLVWVPILQIFPMYRAAGMSGWWCLALLIPGANILAQIVWCFKIVQARRKSGWVILFLLLPGTNLLAFLYLAFSSDSSGGGGGKSKPSQKPTIISRSAATANA